MLEALTQDHAQQGFALGCLIGDLALDLSAEHEEARKELASIMARWSVLVTSCLTEARNQGGHDRNAQAGELASTVIQAWEGAAMRGRVDRSRAPYDRFLTCPCRG
ncbi:TetR family transcriptional regulator C-terminal domain-containing protein [Streptomyces canus]|uniref:TetR family transcriptional regulator C-terminal domain-containing protein n=1 Tax=Streptomyces canus TaxID=58343 RepID=UPI003868F165